MNLQDGVSLSESLIITLFSMGIVFLTLIIISLLLEGFKLIFYKEDSQKSSVEKEAPAITKEIDIDEEIIAVIGAAIAAAIAANDGSSMENLKIKSIKGI